MYSVYWCPKQTGIQGDEFMKPRLRHFLHPLQTAGKLKRYLCVKPRRMEWLVNIYKRLTEYREPEKWVFIAGCYNSGTTLLEHILASHPDISALDEGVFLTDRLITPEELGWTRMWHKVTDKVRLTEADTGIDAEKVKRDWSIFFDSTKPVFLEKSIVNSTRMRWLQKHFNNSYFIAIIRNGYAVAEGIRRKAPVGRWGIQQSGVKGTYPIEMCAEQWMESNRIIEEDSAYIERFMKIHYESLCADPKKVITGIYGFLGIDPELHWHSDTEWEIQEKKAVIKNMNERSFRNLTEEEILKIEEVAEEGLIRYNYPLLSKSAGSGTQ